MKKRALGGKATLYNAKGSPAAASAVDTKGDGFRKGGKVQKRARGGKVGGSPFSSARSLTSPGGRKGGHEGESVPTVD